MHRKFNLANLNKLEEEKTRDEMKLILAGGEEDETWECSFSAETCTSFFDHHGNKNAAVKEEPTEICECGWWIFNKYGMSA